MKNDKRSKPYVFMLCQLLSLLLLGCIVDINPGEVLLDGTTYPGDITFSIIGSAPNECDFLIIKLGDTDIIEWIDGGPCTMTKCMSCLPVGQYLIKTTYHYTGSAPWPAGAWDNGEYLWHYINYGQGVE